MPFIPHTEAEVREMLRAYVYALMLGRDGMRRVAEFSTLNANYLLKEMMKAGFETASALTAGRPMSL